jgi:hypothetical protein
LEKSLEKNGNLPNTRNAKVLQEFSPFRALDAPLTVVSTMIRRTFKGATVAEDSEQHHVPKSDAPLGGIQVRQK